MKVDNDLFLDGNAAAGELRDVFVVDVTAAIGECGRCGMQAPMATTRVYAMVPGVVIRCANCENVLIRLVKGAGRAWLDMRGLAHLQLTIPQ